MRLGHFYAPIVGLTFNPEYPACVWAIETRILNLSLARPGAPVPLRLVRNPNNEHDANAIEVWVDKLPGITGFLGHLPRYTSAAYATELDADPDSWAAEVEKIVWNDKNPDQPGVRLLAWRKSEGKPPIERA